MVFFTCNACGESLKKAQVDKHVAMCRGCQVLSCIDCGKDFWGDDYKNHTRCISEDQKYGGKGYEAKSNKGDVKQQQWIQRVQEAMDKPGISAKLRDVLHQVSSYDNVPRKKAKFQNWMRNSMKITNPGVHNEVWDIISASTDNGTEDSKKAEDTKLTLTAEIKVDSQTQNGSTENTEAEEKKKKKKEKKLKKLECKEARRQNNGRVTEHAEKIQEPEEEQKKKKKGNKRKQECLEDEIVQNGHSVDNKVSTRKTKKRKDVSDDEQTAEAETTEETEDQAAPKGKFNWKGTIKAVLRQSPEQELAVKKLRKKVLAAYFSFSGDENFKTEQQLITLFNKKISGNPKFRLLKEKVRLVK
ncbi:cell growth-regulating nucleolar protein [Genypterus blacodes]|uniref:cell growth-regulating nucleolar protein n=1 Tax=Genypterus blacodes TaxID=154954 RepID=UPI003F764E73